MTPEIVVDVGRDALMVVVMLSTPLLVTALVIGLAIGMIQAATQIQEMTLSFIPKLFGMFAVLMFVGHWMLRIVTDFTIHLYESVPGLVG